MIDCRINGLLRLDIVDIYFLAILGLLAILDLLLFSYSILAFCTLCGFP